MQEGSRELIWLRQVRDFAQLFASTANLRDLLPMILDAAIQITGAERGFLVRVLGRKADGGFSLQVEEARGFDRADLDGGVEDVSRTVVSRVLDRPGRGLVTTSEEDADVIDASSVQARRVMSIACFPMCLRGEIRGVLYLDHRADRGVFRAEDLSILHAFADQAALAMETATLHEGSAPTPPTLPTRLIGDGPAMLALQGIIERVARSWEPVLILGESGTGKELVARDIHARGELRHEPFLAINCAAMPESLLESELFGYEKGAFSGADRDRAGLFEQAGRGTIFLDEVGDMSLTMQSKLLRVLQEKELRPVGGRATRKVSCRVIAATHQDLSRMVSQGTFRADLFYRLDVLRVPVPALRRRPEDVATLIEHFVRRLGKRLSFTPKAQRLLVSYAWPGNVRQLENEVRRLVALGVERAGPRELSPDVQGNRGVAAAPGELSGKTLAQVERAMVEAALAGCGGNKAQAARQLGIPRSSLYDLIDRYGLT